MKWLLGKVHSSVSPLRWPFHFEVKPVATNRAREYTWYKDTVVTFHEATTRTTEHVAINLT